MCPDISLYDFRVLGPDLKETEFAIIAALQFIRYLNDRDNFLTIHGANLSLSIPHDVHNFACGRTPICNECERVVDSGRRRRRGRRQPRIQELSDRGGLLRDATRPSASRIPGMPTG